MRHPNSDISAQNARKAWDESQALKPMTAHCKLITPMYGGGVSPGRVDRDMPIRASAIRGQLRFWWRLLHGAGRTSQELFEAESALWGGISGSGRPRASQVRLQIKTDPVQPHQLATRNNLGNFPAYALILNPHDNPELLKPGYSFKLLLQFAGTVTPSQHDQVVEALRWWASFSGVGARTRRGLGAVKVERVESDDGTFAPVCADEVSGKGGKMALRTGGSTNATVAWREAVDKLRDFRQGRNVGRDPGHGPRPGRSRWPEADTIRRLPHITTPTAHTPAHPVNGFYPRAAFGLPIVFQFNPADVRHGDPGEHVLEPEGHDRMASPLILRPYFDGTNYRPLALLLPGWQKRVSVNVRFGAGTATPAWPDSTHTTWRESLAGGISPMSDHRGTDALSAFMQFFTG